MLKHAAVLLIAGLSSSAALAQPAVPGSGVQASQAWSRVTAPGVDTVAVYVTLKAPVLDRLVGASSPEAKTGEVQQTVVANNVVVMRPVAGGLTLPPGNPVSLQPGGYQIMLSGLNGPLKLGQTFPLHLTFAVSQPIDLVARVAAVGVSTPPAAGADAR